MESDGEKPAVKRKTKAAPRQMTERRLQNIAKYYVERFATTAAHLRRVLVRRVDKACKHHGDDRTKMIPWVEATVEKLVKLRIVDDARYALDRARALRRLNRSPQKIRAHLMAKGVPSSLVRDAIAATEETETGGDATYEAAVAYARRRRLGPFRTFEGTAEEERKQATKDLAAMGRAGFSYDMARRVMALTPEEAAA
jgi:regulatory protein